MRHGSDAIIQGAHVDKVVLGKEGCQARAPEVSPKPQTLAGPGSHPKP